MATGLKTVCFPLPPLASITDAVATNFGQITVDLPEGSKVFRKVWVEVMADDIITATGGTINEWRISLQLAAAGYNTVTNTNDMTNSGENFAPFVCAEFTSYFTTNWSGTAMTCDIQVYLDQTTGTTLGFTNGTALLWVTYEYDDTSATQVKTAFIPFDSPLGALATSKPGTPTDTLPAFDTFFPEASVSYKHIKLLVEANEAVSAATTATALNVQLDSLAAYAGGSHVAALQSDRFVRELVDWMSGGSPIFTTNATHSLYVWSTTVARFNHLAMVCIVTYTFDASANNDQNVSLLLPMNSFNTVAPGTTTADAARLGTELWIEEPATVTVQKSAVQLHWDQIGAVSGINFRVNAQSYVTYTDAAAVMCGSNILQRTCDAAITLARGWNRITCDIYRTDTTDKMWGLSAMLILNYKCGKPSGGYARSNHTVIWMLRVFGTSGAGADYVNTAEAIPIPEATYWLNNISAYARSVVVGANTESGLAFFAERLSAEGWIDWELLGECVRQTDPETGLRVMYREVVGKFKLNPGDPQANPLDIENSRRYWMPFFNNIGSFVSFGLFVTYHSITWAVTRAIAGSAGGTVNIDIHRKSDGVKLAATSRVGNGNYTVTLYDNTASLKADAREDATHVGRSEDFVAS